jgi:DNA-binding NarL/FixJ family response regulator
MNVLPLFSHPLTVALIDDDSLFLEAMTALLKENYPLKMFNNPINAVDFFYNYTSLLSSLKLIREDTEEIGVIIIDHNMPGMNGIEVCRKLKLLPIKKILLTGEGSDKFAIDALSEGVIDCFLRKDSLSLPEDINLNLKLLIQEYLSSQEPCREKNS